MHLEMSIYFFEPVNSGSNSHCTIQLLVLQLQVCECGSAFALYCTAGCFSPLLVRRFHGAFGDVCGSNLNATWRIEVAVASLNQTPKILNTILAFHACQSTHFIHILTSVSDIAQWRCTGNEWNEGYSLLEYGPMLIGRLLLTLGEPCCFRFHRGQRILALGVASFSCTLVTNEH